MRITEGQLRRIIRETLLHEARITPDNLPDGITLKLKVTAGGDMIIVNAWKDGNGHGTVEAHRTRSKRSPCRGAQDKKQEEPMSGCLPSHVLPLLPQGSRTPAIRHRDGGGVGDRRRPHVRSRCCL